MLSLGSKVKRSVGNFYDLNFAEDFLDFFPGHGPHCGNVGQAVSNQEFPHVEMQAALGIRIEAGNDWSKAGLQSEPPGALM
jgi:hypothetical protein